MVNGGISRNDAKVSHSTQRKVGQNFMVFKINIDMTTI